MFFNQDMPWTLPTLIKMPIKIIKLIINTITTITGPDNYGDLLSSINPEQKIKGHYYYI